MINLILFSNFFELESFGNLKLESGFPTDKWAVSCIELIRNRVSQNFLLNNSIKNINILRIWKITNKPNRIIYDNNYDCLIDNFNKFGDENKFYDYLFLYCKKQNLESISELIFENFQYDLEKINKTSVNHNSKENEIFILSTHLDKSEEVKFFDLKKKLNEYNGKESNDGNNLCLEFYNHKFYTVICKCINFENLIAKSTKSYSEDLSENITSSEEGFNDILEIANNYNFNSGKSILEISNSNKDKKFYLLKNRTLFIPEYLIEYNYNLHNQKGKYQNNNNLNSNNNLNKGKLFTNPTLRGDNFVNSIYNILISSYSSLREGKLSELKAEFLRNFNLCLKTLINSEVSLHINKTFSNKNFSGIFQFYEELNNTDLFFAKNSIFNFLNHCFKFLNKESFIIEFAKIKENLQEIKNVKLNNPTYTLNYISNTNLANKNKSSNDCISENRSNNEKEFKLLDTDEYFYIDKKLKHKIESKEKNKNDSKISISEGTYIADSLSN